jgi:glycine/D-amino acid oxidase-like deaminating enzyme
LAIAARNAGAKIYSNSPLSPLHHNGAKWLVKTPCTKVSSDWIILVTNAYSDDLLPGLKKSVLPLAPI